MRPRLPDVKYTQRSRPRPDDRVKEFAPDGQSSLLRSGLLDPRPEGLVVSLEQPDSLRRRADDLDALRALQPLQRPAPQVGQRPRERSMCPDPESHPLDTRTFFFGQQVRPQSPHSKGIPIIPPFRPSRRAFLFQQIILLTHPQAYDSGQSNSLQHVFYGGALLSSIPPSPGASGPGGSGRLASEPDRVICVRLPWPSMR